MKDRTGQSAMIKTMKTNTSNLFYIIEKKSAWAYENLGQPSQSAGQE